MARFILTKDKKIFDIEFFGFKTWGSAHQESIDMEDGKYYFDYWDYDSLFDDDTYWREEIDVEKTSDNIEDLVDEILEVDSDKYALLDGKVVAAYKDFANYGLPRRGFDWNVVTNSLEDKSQC